MTNKILRADGTTQISNIKSCVYTENVNASTDLRPGCVSSACINVTVYGSQSSAPASGEALTYYQVDSEGTETLIGTFYAEPAITTRDTYTFVAYDAASKLDVDFSETLKSIQSSFPMTVYEIVQRACTVAGVTLTSSSWPLSTQTVQAFSGDGISCRDIVSWAAEIACRFVRCNTSGGLVFAWYSASNTSIGTSAGTNQIAYKQDGLYYENYSVRAVGSVAVRPVGSEGAAYIYPQSVTEVYASADDNGVVTLYNLTASDDGNGNITLSGAFTAEDDGNGNVSIVSDSDNTNSLVISQNLLLMSASSTVMNAVAQNIYTEMRSLPSWRPSQISVFSFENVFRAGDIVTVTDSQGVSFTTLVMKLSISTNGASLSSSGNQLYSDYESGSNKALANLSANLIKFAGDVVFVNDLTDGSTVISGDNIQTGTIAAERIDAANLQVQAANITGTLTIGQLPSDVATDSEVTTITETTIQTTSVTANNLVVKAANIDGTLTATQIDATNLNVAAANITGQLVASQIDATNLNVNAANVSGTLTSVAINNGNGTFSVTSSGALTATNATITGAITATSLTLGNNVTINGGQISGLADVATSGDYSDLFNAPDLTVYVEKDGTIGSAPASGVTGFKVSSAGLLQASNAIIYGTLYSSAGTIGGMTLSSSSLYTGMTSLTDTTNSGVYVGTDGIALGAGAFKVTSAGALTATSADISGTITTVSGLYKTVLAGGQLVSYYDSTIYGAIVSTYLSGSSAVRGISLRATDAGDFVTIGTLSGSTYTPKFVVSKGNYSATYSEPIMVFDSMLTYTIRLRNNNYLCWYDSNGTAYSFAYMTYNDLFYLGHTAYPTYVQGSTLYLGSTSFPTYIRGTSVGVSGATSISGNVSIGDSTTSYTLMLNGQNITSGGGGGTTYTFDSTPTSASTNPVTSGGIFTAMLNAGKKVWTGTCSTAATTSAKTVTISGITALSVGLTVRVTFTYAQLATSTPTLNLNDLGAKTIYRSNGTTSATRYEWGAGATLTLVYNGTGWVNMGGLLWQNPSATAVSVTATFAAQTISIYGMSSYDMIMIEYCPYGGSSSSVSSYRDTKTVTYANGRVVQLSWVDDDGEMYGFYRSATLSSTGVTFSGGYSYSDDADAACVPTRIYGLRI